ncbi:P-II family nitrogen regulator [Desulfitibacter alkalitolerans]|uniref:P-II family nitrogen regulator n=1 Tax=Desulfitibacter alkalitolerans TaxID=264641 RepID=UPI000481D34F|nr:P-II family nitrogen regulator [Desulfitibacter alkalitolerans]
MKKIDSIIRPSKIEDVKEKLNNIGVTGMTVSQVLGYGMQKGHKQVYRGNEYNVNLLPKVMISIIVADDMVDKAVDSIIEGARTGEIGDGKIFIYNVEEAIRIRTGEKGQEAL